MNRNIKLTIICMIMSMLLGCNREDGSPVNEVNNSNSYSSAATIQDGRLRYKNISTLYKEINEGLVPNVEVFRNLKLEEINNGLAVFLKPTEGNSYEILEFVITPELQKQLDDAGVYYHTEGTLLYPEYLSTMTIEGVKYVGVEDLDTAEEFAETRSQIIKRRPDQIVSVNGASFVTKIVDIDKVEHNLTREDLEIKVYDTIEKIDEGIRTGEINSGGIFTMTGYKILDQSTILVYSSGSDPKELCITPFIAEQLKEFGDERLRVEYKEINEKNYIIGLSKI